MATQIIPHRSRNLNSPASQARREEALRIARERIAVHQANALPVIPIHYTSDPGPDFTRRAWR